MNPPKHDDLDYIQLWLAQKTFRGTETTKYEPKGSEIPVRSGLAAVLSRGLPITFRPGSLMVWSWSGSTCRTLQLWLLPLV